MRRSHTSFTFAPIIKPEYCGADPRPMGATITVEGLTEEQVEYLRERMTRMFPDVVNYKKGSEPDESG